MNGQIIDPVVEIGGEKYLLHTMDRVELEGYLNMVRGKDDLRHKLLGLYEDMPLIRDDSVYYTNSDGTRRYFMNLSVASLDSNFNIINQLHIGAVCGDGELDTEQMDGDNGSYVCWMPTLVPLDKDEESMRASFCSDNPDGTLIRDLYYLQDGKVRGLTVLPHPVKYRTCRNETDLTLVDSGPGDDYNAPITWVCYDGMLVPFRALAKVSIRVLYKKGFLPIINL